MGGVPAEPRDLYDVALAVTDEVLGDGVYAHLNAGHPDPGVRAAIARSREQVEGRS